MAEQIVLPFRLIRKANTVKAPSGDLDLIDDRYFDGVSYVVVTGISPSNPNQVIVERESDGKRWTVPVGLIRLIVGPRKRRRRTA